MPCRPIVQTMRLLPEARPLAARGGLQEEVSGFPDYGGEEDAKQAGPITSNQSPTDKTTKRRRAACQKKQLTADEEDELNRL